MRTIYDHMNRQQIEFYAIKRVKRNHGYGSHLCLGRCGTTISGNKRMCAACQVLFEQQVEEAKRRRRAATADGGILDLDGGAGATGEEGPGTTQGRGEVRWSDVLNSPADPKK